MSSYKHELTTAQTLRIMSTSKGISLTLIEDNQVVDTLHAEHISLLITQKQQTPRQQGATVIEVDFTERKRR